MNAPILLKTCTHSIFASALSSAVVPGKETAESGNQHDSNVSSLTADIDFDKGSLAIEGDWYFIMTCNKHVQPEWFNYHTQRVHIEASIYPSCTIDLSDINNDGAVFVLEGNIKDSNNNLSSCSGLLILDKETGNSLAADKWNISFYLYDNNNEDCEIALKMPVFINRSNIRLN